MSGQVMGAVLDRQVDPSGTSGHRDLDPLSTLTQRELEILGRMAEGRSNAAIAAELFVSAKTVETHIARVFQKLGLLPEPDTHRRVLAVVQFLRHG